MKPAGKLSYSPKHPLRPAGEDGKTICRGLGLQKKLFQGMGDKSPNTQRAIFGDGNHSTAQSLEYIGANNLLTGPSAKKKYRLDPSLRLPPSVCPLEGPGKKDHGSQAHSSCHQESPFCAPRYPEGISERTEHL
jgi:hypothetical protein